MKTGLWGLVGLAAAFPRKVLAQTFDVERVNAGDTFRIAFGSCLYNSSNRAPLDWVIRSSPDAFVWLGDNIYADTKDPEVFRAKYALLGANPSFQELLRACPNMACWDDHDYGEDDAGGEFEAKDISKAAFLEFWEVANDDPRRYRGGLYHSKVFGEGDRTVRVIQLDTRYFRGDHRTANSTLLGEAQWSWLEQELLKPARLRIITSGTTIFPDVSFDAWHMFPWERERLIKLVRKHEVERVVFVSGDRHWSDLSALPSQQYYPLYELCASSFDQRLPITEHNALRIGTASDEPNFGVIDVDWGASAQRPNITFSSYSTINGRLIRAHTVSFDHISLWPHLWPNDATQGDSLVPDPSTPTNGSPSPKPDSGPPTSIAPGARQLPRVPVIRSQVGDYTITGRRIRK